MNHQWNCHCNLLTAIASTLLSFQVGYNLPVFSRQEQDTAILCPFRTVATYEQAKKTLSHLYSKRIVECWNAHSDSQFVKLITLFLRFCGCWILHILIIIFRLQNNLFLITINHTTICGRKKIIVSSFCDRHFLSWLVFSSGSFHLWYFVMGNTC